MNQIEPCFTVSAEDIGIVPGVWPATIFYNREWWYLDKLDKYTNTGEVAAAIYTNLKDFLLVIID